MNNQITETLKAAGNEATNAPYWLILDPKQNMECNIHALAGQITGPFFSRKDAQEFLEATRYNFGTRAVVYCHSGCYSRKYLEYCRSLQL